MDSEEDKWHKGRWFFFGAERGEVIMATYMPYPPSIRVKLVFNSIYLRNEKEHATQFLIYGFLIFRSLEL
jgi:hypothetical protein